MSTTIKSTETPELELVSVAEDALVQNDEQILDNTDTLDSATADSEQVELVVDTEVAGKSKSGKAVAVNIADVTFTSQNPEVASVDANGVVTLNKVGTTTLRAEYTSFGVTACSTVSVNVEPKVE